LRSERRIDLEQQIAELEFERNRLRKEISRLEENWNIETHRVKEVS